MSFEDDEKFVHDVYLNVNLTEAQINVGRNVLKEYKQKVREAIDEVIYEWNLLVPKLDNPKSKLCLLEAIETIEYLKKVKLGLDDEKK